MLDGWALMPAGAGVVVGIGRTAASLAQCYDAIAAGARLVTHVMSNMPAFKHRDPGPVGLLADGVPHGEAVAATAVAGEGRKRGLAASTPLVRSPTGSHLTSSEIFFSLAVSSLHSCTVNLAHGANPHGLILLSGDAGEGQAMVADAGEGGEEAPGTISQCARQLCRTTCGDDPASSLLCGSAHPARLLNLPGKGRLTPGADADLVLLDPETLSVRACYVAGRLAWSHPSLHGALWFHL